MFCLPLFGERRFTNWNPMKSNPSINLVIRVFSRLIVKPRARGGIQLGPGDAQAFRQRHAPGPTGLPRRALFGHFAAPERGLGAETGLGKFHDGPEAFTRSSKLSNLTHLITAKKAVSTTGC